MRDQTTAHDFRGGYKPLRTGDWLTVAAALAPAGFDPQRDGVCIHRGGTVLYVGPAVPRLLGLEGADGVLGRAVVDLVCPEDRARVADALRGATTDGSVTWTTATFEAPGGRAAHVELSALRAEQATPPVDVLYVRAADPIDPSAEEDERFMDIRDGERMDGAARVPAVLICDDEARLGTLTAGLLTEYGFHPVTVGTGEAALSALAAESPAIDVVLLDVNLSHGTSARDVLATMLARRSTARVILTSGLAAEDVDTELTAHPFVVGYVAKPYAVEQLVQSIRRALDAPPS